MYYGTQPLELDTKAFLNNEEKFAQEYLKAFIEQKAMPMYKAGMAVSIDEKHHYGTS